MWYFILVRNYRVACILAEHSAHLGRDPRRRPLCRLLRGAHEAPERTQVKSYISDLQIISKGLSKVA